MKVLAVGNAKGGTGKTTAAVNLAHALAESGRGDVLLLDFDPQASCTHWFEGSIGDGSEIVEALEGDDFPTFHQVRKRLFLAPSGPLLGSKGLTLLREDERGPVTLRACLKGGEFAWVVIDSPPSLNHIAYNVLNAADQVVIPCECSLGALAGLSQYLQLLEKMEATNPALSKPLVLPSRYDRRTKHAGQALAALDRKFGKAVLPAVPESVKLKDAWAARKTLFDSRAKSEARAAFEESAARIKKVMR